MKKLLFSLLLALAPPLAAAAAGPLEHDLARGLAYVRVHTLPADLPTTPARRGATILDLRYTSAGPGATTALGDWLKSHCTAVSRVFVLVNADSAAGVLAYFNAHTPSAGLVTLGSPTRGFTPDIVITVSPAAERTAYDALEKGTPVAALLADPTVKLRHDEAAIALERTAPAGAATDADGDLADPADAAPPSPPAPPVVTDHVLLRAVQLHQALVALRKL
jgi:hypothetical protein